jgi:hypothetical protein
MVTRNNARDTGHSNPLLAERLKEVWEELFGEYGVSELASRLGIPARTWQNYEMGIWPVVKKWRCVLSRPDAAWYRSMIQIWIAPIKSTSAVV